MVCVLALLLFPVLLTESFSAGEDPVSPCPPQWLLFGQRCFAFFPVWSSWSSANSLCSQTGGHLVSLHTPEEKQFLLKLANTSTHVWLGGFSVQQDNSWFWSEGAPFRISGWTNQMTGKMTEGGVCLEMDPKSGDLHSAPCGELRFYICSTQVSSVDSPIRPKQVKSGIVPGVSLFDVMLSRSGVLPEEILRSSSFLAKLQSGHMPDRCYSNYIQQEALYMHRVSSTLEVLIGGHQESNDMNSLLRDTFKQYSCRNQSLPPPLPPQWLQFSLQSFHSLVLEEPVYWLVALSARAWLRSFLAEELLLQIKPGHQLMPEVNSSYRKWMRDSLKDVIWTNRFKVMIEENQDKMDVFKVINIFREHMMNQKIFYRAVDCDVDNEG
ncbi:C-type mannose receptor 2-like isoform X2 [Platichthys flesus]|uniref:C-type mannose receptor 2-like isoform X2 n=1 Tax=Platichthys flesus TaxID=8260 RepID=UPI002DBA42BA|nr:C-type mannose receptor 2-like isoform X2 [Platichthys flesus]